MHHIYQDSSSLNITSSLQSQQTVGWTLPPHRDMFERWNLLLSQTSTSRTWLFDVRTCTRPGTTGPPWRSGSASGTLQIWEKVFVRITFNITLSVHRHLFVKLFYVFSKHVRICAIIRRMLIHNYFCVITHEYRYKVFSEVGINLQLWTQTRY